MKTYRYHLVGRRFVKKNIPHGKYNKYFSPGTVITMVEPAHKNSTVHDMGKYEDSSGLRWYVPDNQVVLIPEDLL